LYSPVDVEFLPVLKKVRKKDREFAASEIDSAGQELRTSAPPFTQRQTNLHAKKEPLQKEALPNYA